MSKWQVFRNYIVGVGDRYLVGRKIREGEPLHSGNVEYAGESTENAAAAEALAKELNEKEE